MTDLRVMSLRKDFKTVGWAQELVPKKILTKQKISHGRNKQKFMVKDFYGSGLQFEAPQYQSG
jgi:hypothetical protein